MNGYLLLHRQLPYLWVLLPERYTILPELDVELLLPVSRILSSRAGTLLQADLRLRPITGPAGTRKEMALTYAHKESNKEKEGPHEGRE